VLAPIFVLWLGLGLVQGGARRNIGFLRHILQRKARRARGKPGCVVERPHFGRHSIDLLRHAYFPAAASWILSSLRTSVGFAVVGAIIREYLGSSAGLGYLIAQAEGNFDAVGVFAGILILAIFVLIIDFVLDIAEKRLIKRRTSCSERPA